MGLKARTILEGNIMLMESSDLLNQAKMMTLSQIKVGINLTLDSVRH